MQKESHETPTAVTYFEVVEDVADERDVADPLVQRAAPHLLAVPELLLESIQQGPPEHVPVALLGLSLRHKEVVVRKWRAHVHKKYKFGCWNIYIFLAAETDLHDGVADAPSLFAEHLVL